jgi:hypothetical protein
MTQQKTEAIMADQDARKRAAQEGPARRALDLKSKSSPPPRPEDRTANLGMASLPDRDAAPSGALDAEGQRPVLERSRKVR